MKSFLKINRRRWRGLWLGLGLAVMPLGWAEETPSTETVPPVPAAAEGDPLQDVRHSIFQRRLEQGAPEPTAVTMGVSPEERDELLQKIAAVDVPPSDPLAAALPAPAASATVPTESISQSVVLNLINRLVQRGVLTPQDSTDLINLAKEDALIAQAKAAQSSSGGGNGSVRVTYIPETVRAKIRDEIKDEVLAQAKDEKWVSPQPYPSWLSRVSLGGDVRMRYEADFFPAGNATGFGSNFWNFNSINTGAPFDFTNALVNPPFNNVDENRNRLRLRARLGTDIVLGHGFTAGMRLATGENNSPVSPNQSLGAAGNGQGGNFSKYAIWLDRAFIKYQWGEEANRSLTFSFGRFENPFFSTDIIWDDDLGFDGAAVTGKYKVVEGVTPFFTAGGFPVFNTDFNFSSNQPDKFKSQDKWLWGAQLGNHWKISKDFEWKAALAYYDFQSIEGKISDPFVPLTAADAGNTDASRPAFAQKGNTYIALREIAPDASNGFGTTNQFQYFGLATPFRLAAFTTRLDINRFDPFHLWLTGEAVKNLAFNENRINRNGPSNLIGPVNNNGSDGFEGGSFAWTVRLNLGKALLEKSWDWNLSLGYRYVESDAVVDGFTDSDFGGGGTNLKGYTIGGNLALAPFVSVGARWLSADSIAGPTFKEDIIQFDLNAKF